MPILNAMWARLGERQARNRDSVCVVIRDVTDGGRTERKQVSQGEVVGVKMGEEGKDYHW